MGLVVGCGNSPTTNHGDMLIHTSGEHADVDVAWDLALDELNETMARRDMPHGVDEVIESGVRTQTQATRLARVRAGAGEGVVAVAWSANRMFTKTRGRVVVENPELPLPPQGDVLDVTGGLGELLVASHNATVDEPAVVEALDEVVLLRRMVRTKIVTERAAPPNEKQFAAIQGSEIKATFPTQTLARSWVKERLRESGADSETYNIVALVQRQTGPLLVLRREPKLVKGTFKLSFAIPKQEIAPAVGWVFAWQAKTE